VALRHGTRTIVTEEPPSDVPVPRTPAVPDIELPRFEPLPSRRRTGFASFVGGDTRRRALIWLGIAALCVIISLDVAFIVRRGRVASVADKGAPQPPPAPGLVASPVSTGAASSVPPVAAPLKQTIELDGPVFAEEGDEPSKAQPSAPKRFDTVDAAAAGSCTTASVEGLSRQIIEQARCIAPTRFTRLPERQNLVLGSDVFPYLDAKAGASLLRVLKAQPKTTMTINSALRTVAQQYLVWRWSGTKRCGVQLATAPGESNHEVGLALDIADHATWRQALEAEKFRWLGKTDLVHFDYRGTGAPAPQPIDVLAFQRLWNLNHPTDKLVETGKYDAATERKLRLSPAGGFTKGAKCKTGKAR
jgi:hypothetical protein